MHDHSLIFTFIKKEEIILTRCTRNGLHLTLAIHSKYVSNRNYFLPGLTKCSSSSILLLLERFENVPL